MIEVQESGAATLKRRSDFVTWPANALPVHDSLNGIIQQWFFRPYKILYRVFPIFSHAFALLNSLSDIVELHAESTLDLLI